MSFATFVARVFGKKVVWVYRIALPTETFHLTGWVYDGTIDGWRAGANKPDADYPAGVDFSFAGINRGEITDTTQAARSEVWVSLPASHPAMVAATAADDLSQSIWVTIWVTYLGDPDQEYVTRFHGRVTGIEPGKILKRLICSDTLTEADRASAAQVASVNCRHVHYVAEDDGSGCGLDLALWQQAAVVTAATGKVLTVALAALQPDDSYRLGILEYGGIEFLIVEHKGSALTVARIVPGLESALSGGAVAVLIAPGCDGTAVRCRDGFDNMLSHGGLPAMNRGESPFDGRSLG